MIRREMGIWKRVNHPNIVPFLGTTYGFGKEGNTSLVSLWMTNGTLQALLENYNNHLTDTHRLQLVRCGCAHQMLLTYVYSPLAARHFQWPFLP